MNRGTGITSLTLAGVLTLAGARAHAAGFQLWDHSASGLGVAFAGMPVAAQDASTAFWNPAALPLLPGIQVAAALNYVDTSNDFVTEGSTYDFLGDGGDAGSGTPLPALFGKVAINPRLSAGLTLNAPFGLKTEWQSRWAGMFHALRSEVKTVNINPTLGYQVNDWLYLGAGVSYQKLKATLTNGVLLGAIPGVPPTLVTTEGRLEGDDWAWGWNIGALAQLGEGTRIGATYRSAIDYTIEGDLTFSNPALAPFASGVKADLKLPAIISVGVSQKFGTALRALADITWTRWDSVQSLTIVRTTNTAVPAPAPTVLNFKNSWRAGAGLEYQLTPAWILRGGIAYDRSPVQDTFRTPKLPDDDRKWLAAGVRFQPSSKWSVDAGYMHVWVLTAPSQLAPPGPTPGALIGHYESGVNVYGAQMSVHF